MAVLMLTAVAGGLFLPSAVGVASAQDGGGNSTAGGADAADDDANNETVMHELGEGEEPGAVIRNIEVEGTTFRITVHANEYTTMAVSDAGAFASIDEGSSSEVAYETYTIPSGTTRTIEFDVADGNSVRAISITAHGTMIGVVESGFGGPWSGNVGWAVVRAGVAAAALVVGGTALTTSLLTWYAMRRDYRRVL